MQDVIKNSSILKHKHLHDSSTHALQANPHALYYIT